MEKAKCLEHPEIPSEDVRWICVNCNQKLLCALCVGDDKHADHKIIEASCLLVEKIQGTSKKQVSIRRMRKGAIKIQ